MNTPTQSRRVRQQGSTLGQSAVGPSFLDAMFHRAQARLKNRKAAGDVKRQKAVAALFQPATGEADFYDIPTVFRNRLHRSISDLEYRDQQRLIAYTRQASERLAAMEKLETAA